MAKKDHDVSKERVDEIKSKKSVVAFCAYCDKPIYVDEEYREVSYFDDASKKRYNKKKLNVGYAHVHCIEEKEAAVEEIKSSYRRKQQLALAISIVSGFISLVALLLILIFATKLHIALKIVLPLGIGYVITSSLYLFLSENRISEIYKKVVSYLGFVPIKIYASSLDSLAWYIVLKILMLIILVPLAYFSIILLSAIFTAISPFLFPFIITHRHKDSEL